MHQFCAGRAEPADGPFPSQQMIGFLADYAGGEATGDGVEIADARWFKVENLPGQTGDVPEHSSLDTA